MSVIEYWQGFAAKRPAPPAGFADTVEPFVSIKMTYAALNPGNNQRGSVRSTKCVLTPITA